jgi:hypothetical protein
METDGKPLLPPLRRRKSRRSCSAAMPPQSSATRLGSSAADASRKKADGSGAGWYPVVEITRRELMDQLRDAVLEAWERGR